MAQKKFFRFEGFNIDFTPNSPKIAFYGTPSSVVLIMMSALTFAEIKKFAMKFPAPVAIDWIAQFIGAKVVGNNDSKATGINEIHKVEKGDLVFVDHPKYYAKCINSAASIIIIDKEVECPPGKTLLVVDEPFEAYLKIVRQFRPFIPSQKMMSETATIGENSFIFPGVYIGNFVRIGRNCTIHPNVTILDYTEIGDNVIIQAGTVIGSDAFYYNSKRNREIWYRKMESCGTVVIEDDVEIGACCTIDRGVSHETRIGKGTRIDNMVHVGHDTVIGRNCLFAAQVGIAGGVNIEDGVVLWGQVGVSKTLTIGQNTVVFAQSGIVSDLTAGETYFGSPAEEARTKKRELVWIKRIPELWERVFKG